MKIKKIIIVYETNNKKEVTSKIERDYHQYKISINQSSESRSSGYYNLLDVSDYLHKIIKQVENGNMDYDLNLHEYIELPYKKAA